ncbi:alpha/beta-hydrolase [Coccomyxa subellipsoidea C-169]|uniref:Alpha/beta-hydrolase n=1 Tax=Coccomyxa subellipsoidea (strain C-169) TaxID=574566 RepID=I0YYV2_COCSC|nr:alpha/beta-hydrolase [Coccomyxa subellipsoidea C-169]EIE23571.1 alpha/beta-hydrolase [Coccomyxa subellipsoidea C-169]|eukprot:XP_005648115.1 alpha/beta-hydrolase [Coccomyxa subellipsoidea C-169]
MNLGGMWDQLVDCICRPPRDEYSIEQLAGGTKGRFSISGHQCQRDDFTLVSKAGFKLECSHYKPEETAVAGENSLPIVIYCHCNSGSRRDAEEALHVLMPHGIHVVTLDFAGSGRSEGHWVSLGAHEVEDLGVLVAHVREKFPGAMIGLWGRSMGAVTALLYSQRDPSIAGVIVDSPFSRLKDLMVELTEEQKLPIPRAFMRMALSMMKRSVKKRANFNIDDVSPIDVVGQAFIPALFGHSEQDSFISKAHSQKLHAAYAGDKNLIMFEGDHNSHRPQFFYASALIFLNTVLQIDKHLPMAEATATAANDGGLQSASDSNAAREVEDMLVGRTLSVPWIRGSTWAGTQEELEEAWAAEVSRGLMEGEVRLAEASPAVSRVSADGRGRSFSEPPDAGAPSVRGGRSEASAHGPTRTASAASELPLSSDSEAGPPALPLRGIFCLILGSVKTLEQQHADEAAARKEEEHASERLRWQLMQEDEAELLSQALRLSLADQGKPPSGSAASSSATAARPASRHVPRSEYMPASVAAMTDEDAEEAMLVEAIQASLREADNNAALSGGIIDQQPTAHLAESSADQGLELPGGVSEKGASAPLDNGHTSKLPLHEDTNDVAAVLQRGQIFREAMKEPSVSPHAEANGNVAFALDGRKEPKSHVLSDMYQRAAEAAARGDYSAAAAGRFSDDAT